LLQSIIKHFDGVGTCGVWRQYRERILHLIKDCSVIILWRLVSSVLTAKEVSRQLAKIGDTERVATGACVG